MHRPRDPAADPPPRLGADRLDGTTRLAEQDFALALALDENRLLDSHRAVLALFPYIGFHRRAIRQLLMQAQKEFFAGDRGGELPQRRVGELTPRIVPRPPRPARGEPSLEVGDA